MLFRAFGVRDSWAVGLGFGGLGFRVWGLEFRVWGGLSGLGLVAEWIHFTLFWILPTLNLKVYTFGGLMNSATNLSHLQVGSY